MSTKGAGSTSILAKCQKMLGGGDSLRPIDYMILLAIVMMTLVRFWL